MILQLACQARLVAWPEHRWVSGDCHSAEDVMANLPTWIADHNTIGPQGT